MQSAKINSFPEYTKLQIIVGLLSVLRLMLLRRKVFFSFILIWRN